MSKTKKQALRELRTTPGYTNYVVGVNKNLSGALSSAFLKRYYSNIDAEIYINGEWVEDISTIQNCYEDSSINGTPNDNGINIKGIDKGQLKDKNFYVSTLGFDETIWKLDDIVERYYTESVRAHGQIPESFSRMLFFGLK